MKNLKKFLPISLSIFINLIFLASSLYYVHEKGGISFLISKFSKVDNTNRLLYNLGNITIHNYRIEQNKSPQITKIKDGIVFLGDSLTESFVTDLSRRYADGIEDKFFKLFQNHQIVNHGISGDTTFGILNRMNDVTDLQPRKVIIMAGLNDLIIGTNTNIIENNFEKIILNIKGKSKKTQILIESILPVNQELVPTISNKKIIELNQKLKVLSDKYSVTYVDLYPSMLDSKGQLDKTWTWDGVHICCQKFDVWRSEIEKYL